VNNCGLFGQGVINDGEFLGLPNDCQLLKEGCVPCSYIGYLGCAAFLAWVDPDVM
jgi:hypothetical protein